MNSVTSSVSLDRYDLLPQSYRTEKRTQQTLYSWATIIGALSSMLIGVSAATVLQLHRREQRNQEIAVTAIPLIQLRKEVIQIQTSNREYSRWCDAVEAAKPDDCMLQSLAAVAVVCQNGNDKLIIDSLQLQLPTEFPAKLTDAPDWATPKLQISARNNRSETIDRWLERINQSDRIEGATVGGSLNTTQSLVQLSGGPNLQIIATPISTRVLP